MPLLHPGLWVAEIVYFPLETALLQAARAIGCPVSDGGGMAVGQAVGAFELFTGRPADRRACGRTSADGGLRARGLNP
jgi:shikimate dehydrogenase